MFLLLRRGENMRFVQQSQTITVTNFDDKMQLISEKKIWTGKHGNMLPISIRHYLRFVKLWQNKRLDKIAGKSARHTLRERICVLEIIAIIKVSILGEFIDSNNSDVIPPGETLPNSIFIFDDIACETRCNKRILCWVDVDCFYLCQTHAKISKHFIRDNAYKYVDPVQKGRY